jgi:asparaginyl-tRNA synthetase
MPWMTVADALTAEPGTELTIKGWVRTRRDSKAAGGLNFIAVHDGTCFDAIQVVAHAEADDEGAPALSNYGDLAALTTGASIEADGVLVESKGKGQKVELVAHAVRIVGLVEDPDTYPVPQKRHTFEYLREQAHLRVRTNTFGAVARVRHTLAMSIHRFLDEQEFYWVHTPIITGSDCEGAGEMFRVSTLDALNAPATDTGEPDYSQDFFGKETNLTVSGQLNVETYCCALSRVYTFGPTFRAENSNTSRHLAEFWMVEPEIAFADLGAAADLAEGMLKRVLSDLFDRRPDDMAFFDLRIEKGLIDRLKHVIETPFRRLPYTEAIRILEDAQRCGQAKFDYPIRWGLDLQSEHERFLTEEHFKAPVVLINYPKDIKAFYMRVNDPGTDGAPGDTVAAMDVLVPGIGEIIGGSQREERLDILDQRIEEMKLDKDDYWWYRDLRKYGTVPHAGFGLGFERLIQFATGMANIRDVIPFPRAPRQAEF